MKRVLPNRHLTERMGFTLITVMAMLTVLPIVAVVIYILLQGLPAISLEFLTGFPRRMRAEHFSGSARAAAFSFSLSLRRKESETEAVISPQLISRLVLPFFPFRWGSRPRFIFLSMRLIRH